MKKPPKERVLMVTNRPDGELFGLDNGRALTGKQARELQADLFTKPQEDGLFPGFSQTWKREE